MTPAEDQPQPTPPPVQPGAPPSAANVAGVGGLDELQQLASLASQAAQQPPTGDPAAQAAPAPPQAQVAPQAAAQLLQQPTAPSGQREVQLGDVVVAVYPQRHAYLENRMGRVVTEFMEAGTELGADNFIEFLGERSYDVLAALLPSLPSRMPRHVWAGYISEEAMTARDYDPANDRSPTYPQIFEAFTAVWKTNRLDVLGGLKSIVDPSLLQGFLRVEMAKALEQRTSTS